MQNQLFSRREFLRHVHCVLIGGAILMVGGCADDPAASTAPPAQHARVDVVRLPVTDAELSSHALAAGSRRRVW